MNHGGKTQVLYEELVITGLRHQNFIQGIVNLNLLASYYSKIYITVQKCVTFQYVCVYCTVMYICTYIHMRVYPKVSGLAT
jgi:hypothetical protein